MNYKNLKQKGLLGCALHIQKEKQKQQRPLLYVYGCMYVYVCTSLMLQNKFFFRYDFHS